MMPTMIGFPNRSSTMTSTCLPISASPRGTQERADACMRTCDSIPPTIGAPFLLKPTSVAMTTHGRDKASVDGVSITDPSMPTISVTSLIGRALSVLFYLASLHHDVTVCLDGYFAASLQR